MISLDTQNIHLWLTPVLDEEASQLLLPLLSPEERVHADKLRFSAPFILARAGLRALLAEYCHCKPNEVAFDFLRAGKPVLSKPLSRAVSGIEFNLSHTRDYVVWAFGIDRHIGVDIECCRSSHSMVDIVKRFFSKQECQAMEALPVEQQSDYGYLLWCCKEAFLKATGDGLGFGLNKFTIALNGVQASLLDVENPSIHGQKWHVNPLEINLLDHRSALVVSGESPTLLYFSEKQLMEKITRHLNQI